MYWRCPDSNRTQLATNRVVVVGIVGCAGDRMSKSLLSNNIVDKDVFPHDLDDPSGFGPGPFARGEADVDIAPGTKASELLHMHHDAKEHIIYVQLSSSLEPVHFRAAVDELDQSMTDGEFHAWLQDTELAHFKALLFIFTACHHIILMQSRPQFDVQYLSLFRVLQLAKHKIKPHVLSLLAKTLGVTNERDKKKLLWTNLPGQFTPSVAFFFPSPTFKKTPGDDGQSTSAKYKKFRASLEFQISRLLRRCNICIKHRVKEHHRAERGGERTVEADRGEDLPSLFQLHPTKSIFLITERLRHPRAFLYTSLLAPLEGGLDTHVEGFNTDVKRLRSMMTRNVDSVRRHMAQGKRSIPVCREWYSSAKALQTFIFDNFPTGPGENIGSHLDPDTMFSGQRSMRSMQTARRAYLRDLPALYSARDHERRVTQAMKLFHTVACGPAADHYDKLLRTEFTKVWENGRQLCGSISVTGHSCTLPMHDVGAAGLSVDGSAPAKEAHSSAFRTISACGCGRTRSVRDDPFTLRQANETFFRNVRCCQSLRVLEMHGGPGSGWGMYRLGPSSSYAASTGLQQDGFRKNPTANRLFRWELPTRADQLRVGHVDTQLGGALRPNWNREEGGAALLPSLLPYSLSSSQLQQLTRSTDGSSAKHTPMTVPSHPDPPGQGQHDVEGGGDGRNGVPKEDSDPPVCFVGLEYECTAGHRFLQADTDSASLEERVLVFPRNDVPLQVACSFCEDREKGKKERGERDKEGRRGTSSSKSSSERRTARTDPPEGSRRRDKRLEKRNPRAQLQRLFIVTPPSLPDALSLSLAPAIQCIGDLVSNDAAFRAGAKQYLSNLIPLMRTGQLDSSPLSESGQPSGNTTRRSSGSGSDTSVPLEALSLKLPPNGFFCLFFPYIYFAPASGDAAAKSGWEAKLAGEEKKERPDSLPPHPLFAGSELFSSSKLKLCRLLRGAVRLEWAADSRDPALT